MKRTQIYLKDSQKRELDLLAEKAGKPVAEIIREAVDCYIVERKKNSEYFIQKTSGLWKNREDITDSVEYVNALRNDMNEHMKENKK